MFWENYSYLQREDRNMSSNGNTFKEPKKKSSQIGEVAAILITSAQSYGTIIHRLSQTIVTDWAPVIKMAASLVVSVDVLVWLFLLRCLQLFILYYRFREFPDLLYKFYIKVTICLLKHHNSKFKLLCFEFSLCAGMDNRLFMVQGVVLFSLLSSVFREQQRKKETTARRLLERSSLLKLKAKPQNTQQL